MKTIVASLFLLLILPFQLQAQKNTYNRQWNKVYSLEVKSLPKSALAVVDKIYAKAKKNKNTAQLTKALLYQSKFALTQPNAELTIVQKWEKEIESSQAPLKNILESYLAKVYWSYYTENREKYYGRSRTEETINPTDFRTWDSNGLFREINRHYQNSLLNSRVLQETSLASINELLLEAEHSKLYRPTLFDFLAHQAIDFYGAKENRFTGVTPNFNLTDSGYFNEFESVDLQVDSISTIGLALKIYKHLYAFHKTDRDPTAFVQLELERLQFLVDHGIFTNETEVHKTALIKLKADYQFHASSTLIDFELASILYRQGYGYNPKKGVEDQFKKREALVFCEDAIKKFPTSDGALKCKMLRENILSKELILQTETYIPMQSYSRIYVEYTNVDSLSFSAYKISEEFQEKFSESRNDSTQLAELESMNAEVTWTSRLIDLHDHHKHSTEIMVPKLSGGRYLILARSEPFSTAGDAVFAYSFIQVTNLAIIETTFPDKSRFQLVNRKTGYPIEGADVHLKTRRETNYKTYTDKHYTTDKNGFVEVILPKKTSTSFNAMVTFKDDHAVFENFYVHNYNDEEEDSQQIVKAFLFTDRSIYRPGQTVYFKGILMKNEGKKSSVVPNEYVEVSMEDVNGDEVGIHRLKTNAYGSFSGEFTLPGSGLTGEYSIYVEEDTKDENGFYKNVEDFEFDHYSISVEEYKRPTFEVTFNPSKEMYAVNDTVIVQGIAQTFNGIKISGAKFSYHVKRTTQYPGWYYWDYRNSYSEDEEIALSVGVTGKEGEFMLKFKALPDEDVLETTLPVFRYEATIDVTDISGETQNATTTINVGYHRMTATLDIAESVDRKLTNHTISVRTENLNGQSVASSGMIEIYKVKVPVNPVRERPWEAPDLPIITEEEFHRLFPNDTYDDISDRIPEKGKLMIAIPFNTGLSNEVKWTTDKSWELGNYLVELTAKDETGTPVLGMAKFNLFEPDDSSVADNKLLVVELDRSSYQPGDIAKLKIGSSSPDITITVDVERNDSIIKTYVERISNSVKEILIPITPDMGNHLIIHTSGVNYNSFLSDTKRIPIIEDQKLLEIETITFNDKLHPGGKETWSFKIMGNNKPRAEAELLVSMYDASLDQFKQHEWRLNPFRYSFQPGAVAVSAHESFRNIHFINNGYESDHYYSTPIQSFDRLNWFGFSITNKYYIRQQYLDWLYTEGWNIQSPQITTSHNQKLEKGYIAGTIMDGESNTPLGAVNIIIRGTITGTISDTSGKYQLKAKEGDVLVFSFIGFKSVTVKVGSKNVINITMAEEQTLLNEVVVAGRSESESIRMSSSSVNFSLAPNYFDALKTLKAVNVDPSPEGATKLDLSDPKFLYIVDGEIVASQSIDLEDIVNIQVLKGKEASARYGSRGNNGAIIITTKSDQRRLDEEMARVNTRKNFNETAFFFPHLSTDENGGIQFSFTTPESLTRWKLQLLAHTKDWLHNTKTLQAITQKELMITSNAPRFLRQGDEIIFSVKISNLMDYEQDGTVALQLSNAITGESADQVFKNEVRNQSFHVKAKGTVEASWKLRVPTGIDAVQYKVVAKSKNFSDGEQHALPVLSNRILVTETLPMYIRGRDSKTFSFEKLKNTSSPTLQHHRLTLEVTPNPAWYAVQALPYLMEFPHECAEQTFARYYANALGNHIANSNPKIKAIFDQWALSSALISNLEKNPELKSIIINETPWLRDALNETERKKRMALLFELTSMRDQINTSITKLKELQLKSGGFTWFSGGNTANRYITQHIVSGWGHLKHLQIKTDDQAEKIMEQAVAFLDQEILNDYNRILEQAEVVRLKAKTIQEGSRLYNEYLTQQHIYHNHVQYLYMRSFYPEIKIPEKVAPALMYFQNQSAAYWHNFNLYGKGMTALVQHRLQNTSLPKAILQSLRENSVNNEEFGMYWIENKSGWYWYESPIETHALLIEVFSEIEGADSSLSQVEKNKTLDDLRVWLLKNKQTNHWKTTKATTEAIYALLLSGTDWLTLKNQVEVSVGGKKVEPDKTEAGTGYFQVSWKGESVTPSMNEVRIIKKDQGIAWAGMYWQYFEDLDKISSAETPLKISKRVFVVNRDENGEILSELGPTQPIAVGGLLRVRIELMTDRSMEFLHMKDMRAAGLEPVDVLSEYKWQDGLGYYQSIKDASVNFFFESVTPGVYIFEYDLRASNKGNFSNGITTIQCMYAPEFSSHSEGTKILVK